MRLKLFLEVVRAETAHGLQPCPECPLTPKSDKLLACHQTCASRGLLDLGPQREDALSILNNLLRAQFGISIDAIHKCNGYLANCVTQRLGCYRQRHLHAEPAYIGRLEELLQDRPLVQSETAREIAHARSQHRIRENVGAFARELSLQVPAVDAATGLVACARHNVVVVLLLQCDHLRNEFGVVAEVGIHDDDVVTFGELQAVDVGSAEAELAGARLEDNVGCVCFDKLLGDILGAVGGAVVDDDEFPVNVAGSTDEC